MDQAGIAHAGNVARTGIDAFEVPAGLDRLGIMLGQETAAVLLGEQRVETPARIILCADVKNVHDQQIARFGALERERTGKVMDARQIDIADIVGAFIVSDLSASPVKTFHAQNFSGLEGLDHRYVRVPAVMCLNGGFLGRLAQIHFENGFRHLILPVSGDRCHVWPADPRISLPHSCNHHICRTCQFGNYM